MMKIIAAAAIILSGFFAGRGLCETETERINILRHVLEFLRYLEREIKNTRATADLLFSRFVTEQPENCFALYLKTATGSPSAKLFAFGKEKNIPLLCDFAHDFGKRDFDSECQSAEKTVLALTRELERLDGEYENKSKTYKAVSLALAAGLALMLY